MLEPFKNSFLASVGLAAMAQEKLQSTVKELISRGELTTEQGKRVLDSFVSKGEEESQDVSDKLGRELGRWLEKTPFVSRREYEALLERVQTLENRLRGSAPDEDAPDEVEPLEER